MKVKVKLDTASLKRLGLEHGEKAAFAVVLIAFVLFVYKGATREVLDASKQPDKLKSLASAVTAHVQSSTFNADREGFEIVNYSDHTKRDTVAAKNYALPTPFNPPLFDEKGKREDPQYLNVEELRAAAGYGTFAMKGAGANRGGAAAGRAAPAARGRGPAGPVTAGHGVKPSADAELKSQAWAVITGLIPFEKESAEYARVFKDAQDYEADRDRPRYLGYQLERAEISSTQPDKLDWKPIGPSHFPDGFERTAAEVVPPEYAAGLSDVLINPLGPLVDKDWGEAVAHPKVPLVWAKPSQPSDNAADKPTEQQTAVAEAKDQPGQAGPVVVVARTPEEKPADKTAGQPPAQTASAAPPLPAYRLLRVFDYTVERGNRYRYRIKLVLDNPNYNVLDRYLKNPDKRPKELQGAMVLTPEWSEPTDIVTIPNGSGVLAGGVKSSPRSDQVRAKLLLTSIDPESGIPVAVEKEFERSAVANAVEKDVNARDPRNGQTAVIPTVRFQSNMVVLDVYGGAALGGAARRS